MNMPDEPHIDWIQAASLLGDDPNQVPQDMVDIVLELIQSGNERLQELRTKNPSVDSKVISAQAHQLRGSLLNFGFAKVGSILFRVEKQDYSSNEYLGLIDQTQATLDASIKILAERYPSIRIA